MRGASLTTGERFGALAVRGAACAQAGHGPVPLEAWPLCSAFRPLLLLWGL